MAEIPNAPQRATPPVLRVSGLSGRKATRFRFAPNAAERAEIAGALDLIDLPGLDMAGEIRPEGRGNFRLEAKMTAQVVQACSITLAPVPARIAEDVLRVFLAEFKYPTEDEAEVPEDDTTEPLPEVIDLSLIASEALALALPQYPRAPGAALGSVVFAPPGATPLTDEVLKPFAGLAGLAQAMKKPSEDGA